MKTKPVPAEALIRYIGQGVKREKKQIIIDQSLEAMLKKHKTVTADLVVSEASNPRHPMHDLFEWDNEKAGDKFRQMQAYAMILSSRFTVQLVQPENSHMKVLKSVRVRRLVNSFNGEGFKLRTDALKNREDRSGLIEKKKAALRSWCQSVIDIEEFKALRETIEAKLSE